MSNDKWTPEQIKAIETLDSSLIVSAAAGSGKTSVLVERIVNMICNSEKPVSVDKLLIVTFTRAAANEMRQRLSQALESRIEKEPDNRFLLHQQAMLPLADICTMDQFFNSLVKDNFHQLGITPDFRVIDQSESKILEAEAIEESLEEAYENEKDVFDNLLKVLGCDRDDEALVTCIKNLNRYANSYPYPEKWLDEIKNSYTEAKKPQDTNFGKILLEKVSRYCDYAIKQLKYAQELTKDFAGLEKAYELVKKEEEQASYIKSLADASEWDRLYSELRNLQFSTFSSDKAVSDTFEKIYSQSLRNNAKALLNDNLVKTITVTEEEFKNDIEIFKTVIPELIDIVLRFRARYLEKKNEINSLEFDDISHLALNLLIKDGECTDIANELREKYSEILIDEYQDTNRTQDMIFSALSKNEKNLFLVGDVKQSIYGFRLAMPEIFLGRIEEWKNSTDKNKVFVNLDKNFRSRKGVLDGVNYLFERIMNEHTGNIVYDERESLKAGAEYPESDIPCIEMHILDKKQIGKENTSEINFVVDKIEDILKNGQVYDRKLEKMRKAQPKDIAILLRKNANGPAFLRELKSRGLSAYFEDNSGFFNNTEVSVMISLLSVIDNPLQDVPLLSVLMSPIFGFSADDIAKVRVETRKGKLYYAVRNSEDEKCKNFISEYEELKKLSSVVSVSELIKIAYDRTGYLSVVNAMSNGEMRKLNLMLLLDYAESYEQFGKSGLPGFMRFIETMKKNDSDFKPAVSVSESADVIRIMSVHKSKGLEFPIVILADIGSKVSGKSYSLVANQKTGIGMKICDKSSFKKYSTVQYEATKYIQSLDECSEELRALYVAMTRAKERLIITGAVDDMASTANKVASNCFEDEIDAVAIETNNGFLNYLLMGYFRHANTGKLRYYADYKGDKDIIPEFDFSFDVITQAKEEENKTQVEEMQIISPNESLVSKIKERTDYKYDYLPLADFTTKMSASSFNQINNETEYFITEKPNFAQSGKLSAAGRGTAMHRFMEVCDFSLAKQDIMKEKERLVSLGKITQQQADSLNISLLEKFFQSELYKRIESSPKVMREQKFTVFVPLSLVNEKIESDEKILVQGVIDCAFYENDKLVVLDYKTDKINSVDELEERYIKQLEVYKIAAEQAFLTEVKDLMLYSFYLGEEKIIKN